MRTKKYNIKLRRNRKEYLNRVRGNQLFIDPEKGPTNK